MIYGSFDDAVREFVILQPDTPSPWINYLGNEDFFTLISNTSGGYSFYKDARLLRLTRYRYNNAPRDMGGQYFYIKEGDTVWNPGWMPTKTPLDAYSCRYGLGYTRHRGQQKRPACAADQPGAPGPQRPCDPAGNHQRVKYRKIL
jgi:cellobiose phosphorylase